MSTTGTPTADQPVEVIPAVVAVDAGGAITYEGDALAEPMATPAAVLPTQMRRPWRSTVRTLFQALVGLAAMAPLIYSAATEHDPAEAGGWAALALAISGGVTRVMSLPAVEQFLRRFVPFLSAAPRPRGV